MRTQIQPQGNQAVEAQQPNYFVGGLKSTKEPIYLPMELKGRRYMYLLDSGCDHTLVPQSLVERLRNLSVRPTNRRLRGVQDIELDIIGKVTLPMELGGRTIPTEALVSPVYRPWRRPAHRSRLTDSFDAGLPTRTDVANW